MAFVTYGHHALLQGNRKGAISGTLITVVLAIIFTALQGYEYAQAPFTIADSVFGSAFFCSTGLHGLFIAPINFLNLIYQQQKASLKSNSIHYNSNLSNHRINLKFKKGLGTTFLLIDLFYLGFQVCRCCMVIFFLLFIFGVLINNNIDYICNYTGGHLSEYSGFKSLPLPCCL